MKNKVENKKLYIKEFFKSLKFRMIALLAALGVTVGGGALLLGDKEYNQNEGNNRLEVSTDIDKQIPKVKQFSNEIKVNIPKEIGYEDTKQIITESADRVLLQIALKYNERYGTDLTPDDLSLIESKPQFLGVIGDNTYVQDYKSTSPVDYHISDNWKDKTSIDKIYIIINSRTNEIIASIGRVNYKVTNIDTKIVMNDKRKEYLEAEDKIDITEGKTDEEKEQIYNSLKERCLEQDKVNNRFDNKQMEL